jgi:hypothetical protein
VLRNYRGHFKLAGTNIVPSPFSVLEGEALALIEAMEEVIQRGLSYVIFKVILKWWLMPYPLDKPVSPSLVF